MFFRDNIDIDIKNEILENIDIDVEPQFDIVPPLYSPKRLGCTQGWGGKKSQLLLRYFSSLRVFGHREGSSPAQQRSVEEAEKLSRHQSAEATICANTCFSVSFYSLRFINGSSLARISAVLGES